MKIIALGDTHGRDFWKKVVNEQEFDTLLFIGDYFDSFDIGGVEQINNFLDIIEYKKTSGKNVIMLIGNHDHHYFSSIGYTGTSGWQETMAPSIMHVIEANKSHLQMAYAIDNVIFTHAGVGEMWVSKMMRKFPDLDGFGNTVPNAVELANYVNDLWDFKPSAFTFDGYNGYGDDMGQTPIWIRPRSLVRDSQDFNKNGVIQVVGHTGQKYINPNGDKVGYFFIDVLGTSEEFLVIEDGKFTVGKI